MGISAIEKGIRVIEVLAANPRGLTVAEVAEQLDMPRPAAQDVLRSLEACGFSRSHSKPSRYALTMKLAGLGMTYVARSGLPEVYQPTLDRLAQDTGELVRMTLVLGDQLTWVGMSQGARKGLRIAEDTGRDVCLYATAAGKAWLSTMPLERALKVAFDHGFADAKEANPSAICTVEALIEDLKEAKQQGYSISIEEYIPGMAAIAAPIFTTVGEKKAIGTVSIAGPTARMNDKTLRTMADTLARATDELAVLSPIVASFGFELR